MSSRKIYFVTGTDTDVGKTWFSCVLLRAAAAEGQTTAAIKPLAAGAVDTAAGLRNADALALQEAITTDISYEQVNPLCFEPAIAPHIAAQQAGRSLSLDRLAGFCRGVMMKQADLTLIEGAGGWHVPVNGRERLSGLPGLLNVPVILVVGMKLGCLNHALLTAQAILSERIELAGWVANRMDPAMDCYRENLSSLQALMPCPMLAELPWAGEYPDALDSASAIALDKFLPRAVT